MVRIVNSELRSEGRELTDEERRDAEARIKKLQRSNPLRRVRVSCCVDARRDPLAKLGDQIWCDTHGDFASVVAVVE